MELSYLESDPIPSQLSAEQVRNYFPQGVRGLKNVNTNAPVFANQDGSITLEVGQHYTTQRDTTQSNNNGSNNNNNNNFLPPVSPARPHMSAGRVNYTMLSGNNSQNPNIVLSQPRGSRSNQNSNQGPPPMSPAHRVLEDSDEEIGQLIPSPQLSQQQQSGNKHNNNNEDDSDGHHQNGSSQLLQGQALPMVASQLVVRRGKLIMDRVHDHIMLPPLVCRIVDSPEFQRLRYLKQLGSCAYLYPGATHTRFEHSVGVCHLAGLMAKKIARRQPELQVTDLDVLCIMVAGLCHDLGHGPFSHLFEVVVNESLKRNAGSSNKPTTRKSWHHEEMSTTFVRRIFQRLREENDETVVWISDEDINFIVLAIDGLRPGKPWPEDSVGRDDSKRFLLDIVANKRNGIDVDKLDYFMRDSLACYGKAAIDIHISRLINSCRAIRHEGEMQICFEEKMAMSLGDIFSVRAKLHKYAYQHRTTKVVDHMIKDALMIAEPHFLVRGSNGQMRTFVECVDDPEGFMVLGDWILNAIAADANPALAEARDIIHRLHTRKLYALVGGAQLRMDRMSKDDVKMQIIDRYETEDSESRIKLEKSLIVDVVKITYGSSDDKGQPDDPINHVTFFNPKGDIDKAFRLPSDRRNPLFSPMAYSERSLLLLSREKEMQSAAIEAFENWKRVSNRFLETAIPVYNSPAPNRRQREAVAAASGGLSSSVNTTQGTQQQQQLLFSTGRGSATNNNNNNFSASRNLTSTSSSSVVQFNLNHQPQQNNNQNDSSSGTLFVGSEGSLASVQRNSASKSAKNNTNNNNNDISLSQDSGSEAGNSMDGPPPPPLSQ